MLRYVVSESKIEHLFDFSKFLLTWSSECDQQVGFPLFQTEPNSSATRRRTNSKNFH